MDSFDRDRHTSFSKTPTEHQPNRFSEQPLKSLHSRHGSVEAYLRHGQRALNMSRTPSPASSVASFKHPSSSIIRTNSAIQTQLPPQCYVQGSIIHEPRSTMKWIKGKLIGQGSYGKVFIAFNSTTGETMAVKQVEQPETPSDYLNDSIKKMVQALKEENQTLKRLEHPNIVLYLGYEENPDTINIFLEYVPGGTIHSCLVKHGIFYEEVTKSFAAQILNGLAYLHSKAIIHRDLKSENVLVEQGVCKISDFGISKNVQDTTGRFTLMKGTINWMSPEVITGDSDQRGYDEKIDIWSMGCLMLEMWTARRPWENESILHVMEQLIDKKPPPLPIDVNLLPPAQDFKDLCFQPDPSHRPGADVLLQHYYLKLPTHWSFPEMGQMGPGKLRNAADADYRSREMSFLSESAVDPAAEELTQMLSRTIKFGEFNSSLEGQSSPALTMHSVVAPDHYPAARRQSPPLVFIEPPPPRKRSISNDRLDDWMTSNRNSSLASDSSSNQPTKPARKLMIYNPDSNESRAAETKKAVPFVYQPPPLPEKVPYSQQLAPAPKANSFILTAKSSYAALSSALGARPSAHHVHGAEANGRAVKQNATKLRFVQSLPQSTHTSNTSYVGEGSEISTNSSMWQRAPVGRSSTKEKALDNLPPEPVIPPITISNTPSPRLHLSTMGDERPPLVEVYQHMGTFFPHHNLDELVESPIEPVRVEDTGNFLGRRYTMKSIRAIAQEQIERSQKGKVVRRSYNPQSPIWDAPLEEIKEHFR